MAVNIGPKIGIDGEAEYRKELKAIIQETKTYAAETNEAAAAVENADDKEKASAKVKESLAKQIEAQEKLVKKLREGVEAAEKSTGENSETTLKWKEQLAKATTELHNLQGSASNAGGEVKDLTDAEKDAGDQASIFGDVLKANLASEAIKKGLELTKDALVAIKDVMVDSVKEAAAYSDEISTLSKKTGLSTQTLQQFDYMSDLIDVDLNTITGSLTKLTRNMSSAKDGTGAAAEAFEKLGVSITDEAGNLRNSQDVWAETIDALGKIENSTERDALAMDLFGKSAQDLNPLILAGADTLKELQQEAEKTGYVLDAETLGTLNDVQDGFDRLGSSWDTIKRQLGAKIGKKILPDLKDIVGTLQNFAKTGNFDELFDGLTKSAEKALKKLPKIGEKVLNAIPKLISKLADSQIWSSLTAAVGKTLSALFKNAPEIIKAGIKLAGSLLEGVMKGILEWTGVFDAIDDLIYGSSEAAKEAADNLKRVREELEAIPDANKRIEDSLGNVNAKSKEAEKWVEVFDKLSQKTDLTKYETELLKQAVDNLNDLYPELDLSVDESTGRWSKNTDEIRKNIEALQDRYRADAYYRAASEALTDIAKLEAESEALRAQKEALEEQIKPVGELYDRYVQLWDISDAFYHGSMTKDQAIKQLKDLGVEVENDKNLFFKLDGIVDDAYTNWKMKDWELYDQQREFESVSAAVQEYDDKIAELGDDVDYFYKKAEEAAEAIEAVDKAVNDLTAKEPKKYTPWKMDLPNGKTIWAEGHDLSENLLKGYIQGFKQYKQQALSEGRNFIKDAVGAMKDEAQIKSPSKVMEDEIGQNLALGVVKGWDDIFTPSNTREIFSLTPAFDAMTSSASETISNVTNTQNYGGFEINVYAKDGQSVDELADVIMVKIQRAANARKAVFA